MAGAILAILQADASIEVDACRVSNVGAERLDGGTTQNSLSNLPRRSVRLSAVAERTKNAFRHLNPGSDSILIMAKDAKKKKAEKFVPAHVAEERPVLTDPYRKARVAQKQEKKATQKEKKVGKKAKDEDSDAEDADLDAILAEYQKQQEQFLKVTEALSQPPSPRSSSTLVAGPGNSSEIFLFGGEFFNGAVAEFFSDLYVYKVNSDSWRRVTSPNSPLPRSGHAMCQGGNAGGLYLFGGEFSSPKQGTVSNTGRMTRSKTYRKG